MKEPFIIVTDPLWAWWLPYRCIDCINALRNLSEYYQSIATWVIPSNHHMAVPAIKWFSTYACSSSEILTLFTVGSASSDNSYQINRAGHHCSPVTSLREFKCEIFPVISLIYFKIHNYAYKVETVGFFSQLIWVCL